MPHWPKPWGRAAGAIEQLLVDEEFAAAGVKRPDYGITGWVILTLIQHGTPSQIERFVEKALRKDEIWCQLFSEPSAGSDAAAVKTRATRVDGGWKINGQKVWTSGAHYCERGLATVRTDFDVPKHAGITMVILDMKAPGVEVRPLRQITGGSDFNEVFFNDVFVPDEDVVGEPNSGWTVARATLGNERVSIGGGAGGIAPASAWLVRFGQAQRRPGRRRQAAGRPLPGRGPCAAPAEPAPRRPQHRGCRTRTGGQHHQTQTGRALSGAGRHRRRAAGSGCWRWKAARASWQPGRRMGARGMAIAGGTSEVTRNQIAERILGMPRDPLIK